MILFVCFEELDRHGILVGGCFGSMKTLLALEDGRFFWGYSFGSSGEISGEVVFNTSMMGYQEILTDPSYWRLFGCVTKYYLSHPIASLQELLVHMLSLSYALPRNVA